VHRVVAALANGSPFVIQAGDPTGTGAGGPGYNFDLEKSTLPHDYGVVSMARSSDPNSNGSQFFICLSRSGTAFLDGRYTAFGEAVRGADAITAIKDVEVGQNDRPVDPPLINSARTVPAPPFGTGQAPIEEPVDGEVDR
jgi:peptidyl-prolyl cis-trans isomerase B (cyclophilin B)